VAEMGTFFILPIILWKFPWGQAAKDTCDGTRGSAGITRWPMWVPLSGHFKARGNAKVKLLIMIAVVSASKALAMVILIGQHPRRTWNNLVGSSKITITSYQQPLSFFEEGFYVMLFAIGDQDPSLFEPKMEDILEDYQLACSLALMWSHDKSYGCQHLAPGRISTG